MQAEYRGKHGDAFDSWWQSQRATLPSGGVSFKAMVAVRNVAQKEGNRFPQRVVESTWDRGLVSRVILHTLEFEEPQRPILISVDFRPDDPRTQLDLPDEASDEVTRDALAKHLRTYTLQAHVEEVGGATSVVNKGVILEKDGELIPVTELPDRFAVYLAWIRNLVVEAEERFPLPYE